MPTYPGLTPHYSSTAPVAEPGKKLAKWQVGPSYPGTITFNGLTFDAEFSDISVEFGNLGSVDARTGVSETVALASQGKLVTFANAGAVAVDLDSSVPGDFYCAAENKGPGVATLTPTSGTINGAANLAMTTGSGAWLFFDGTNWYAVVGGGGASGAVIHKVGVTVDGFDSDISTGVKGSIQVDFAGTIIGWSIEAGQVGDIEIEVDRSASSAPPAAPSVPNTTTDKISAAAPIALSSAQTAAASASEVSTWDTAVAQWDSIQFNVASVSGVKRASLYIRIQEA